MQLFAPHFSRWNALPPALRIAAGAAASVLLLALAAAAVAMHPARTPLFAGSLHPEQISEVEERLAAWNVPFTPTADNVVVEGRRRSDLLLRLSLAGVPHAHLTSAAEALANAGAFAPPAVIDAESRAGLAAEIEGALRGIDGVDDATVIVAPASPSEFADSTSVPASASVRLRLRGSGLTPETVAGIRAFVAASVPKLARDRVTILDDRGIALRDGAAAASDAALNQQSLQSALDAVFGAGAAIVRVRAEYDPRHTTERDLRRTPVTAAPIAAQRHSESYDGAGRHFRNVELDEDRGSETHEVLSQAAPGTLARLSTAVFVDRTRGLDVQKVRDFAGAAVGFDARRGDELVVEEVDFARAAAVPKAPWWMLYGAVASAVPALIVTVGLVICARTAVPPLTSLARSVLERAATERASKAAAGFPPARVRSMLEREPPHAAAAIISALPAATATAVLELYPPHEREAIVQRMQRQHSPILPDAQELLRRHA